MITSPLVALRLRFVQARRAIGLIMLASIPCSADIIWSDLGTTLAHETGPGTDILAGAVKRDDSAQDTLFFKFHVNPKSDAGTEPYFAAFELYEGEKERLAVGNALNAWAYGAFNVLATVKTNFNVFETGKTNNLTADYGVDLNSCKPTSAGSGGFYEYELPRTGIERTIVFKVQYVPGGKDLVTVWLDPDLGPGATEAGQLTNLTTKFEADASFNQIRLRHGGRGDGWTFSEMAIATSFSDFALDESGGKSGQTALPLGRSQWPFTFRVWQREQGLPQNFVRALAQTKDGYVWVGSDAGVSRFDGARFVSFGLPEGFQAGSVQTMLGDKQGALWIGSAARGLGRWQNGKFTAFTTQTGLPSDTVNALAEDNAGRLWIGTDAGLVICQDGVLKAPRAAKILGGKAITALFCDAHGTIWIGAKGEGLFSLAGGQLSPVHDSGFDNLLQNPHCLLVDHEGRLWVGAGEDSVLYREGNQWRPYRLPHHLARHWVSALVEDPEGTVWAGSKSEGLFQFKHGKLVAVNASSGLSDNLVEALLVDQEGTLWVGTHEGLNRLQPRDVSVLSYCEGLGHGAVQGLAEVTPGVVWASKSSEGLYRWNGRYFSPLSKAGIPAEEYAAGALLMALDGSCWMGGAHGLLQFKDARGISPQPGLPALTNLDVTALAQDAQGRLWAGTRQGQLWSLHAGQWIAQGQRPLGHAITALATDPSGSIWVGTAGDGLFSLTSNAGDHWTKRSGWLSDWIRTLYFDSENTLWIGTGGGGLSRLQQGRVATFTTREGLPDNTVSQILEDDAHNLWLGGDRGIVCVSKHALEEVAAQKIAAVYPRVYGRTEGMLSEECISGFFPVSLKTKSGQLWFPTQDGIVVLDPRHTSINMPAPAVVLEETLVDGVPVAPDSLRLAPGKHRIEFRYTGINFDAPERVRFRYRLDNLDSDWVEAGTGRVAPYSYVPPGHYQFHVIACNSEGVWNSLGASVALVALPHIWQEWWFFCLIGLGLAGSAGGILRVVVKRKMQDRLAQLERERVLERERARIAQDLHDDLGSSLTRISLLSGLAREDKNNATQVEAHVKKISQSAAQTLRALEEIVWAIRPGSDSLQSLVEYIAHFANELFEGDGVRCRLDFPADLPSRPLPPEMRHNIFLVVKEALTNSLKHSGAHEVQVCASVMGDSLQIIVQDDGLGFDILRQSRGQGLGNMRRRAEAMGGHVCIESESGQGTTVTLRLRFASAVQTSGKAAA